MRVEFYQVYIAATKKGPDFHEASLMIKNTIEKF